MNLFSPFSNPNKKFQVGQEWHYQTRNGEENSTLKIVKIEEYENFGKMIHISILDLQVKHPQLPEGILKEALHIPISEEALKKSITKLKNDRANLPDYEFGYVRWKNAFDENQAGYFNIPVNEVVEHLEVTANKFG